MILKCSLLDLYHFDANTTSNILQDTAVIMGKIFHCDDLTVEFRGVDNEIDEVIVKNISINIHIGRSSSHKWYWSDDSIDVNQWRLMREGCRPCSSTKNRFVLKTTAIGVHESV